MWEVLPVLCGHAVDSQWLWSVGDHRYPRIRSKLFQVLRQEEESCSHNRHNRHSLGMVLLVATLAMLLLLLLLLSCSFLPLPRLFL